ncbi:MAG TPA: hypothetical protein PLE30_05130 [Candidatus Kapabacteria bacterium]|nr:hypothetical protein [Candidatus Kapabacteria bacterium]
MQKFSKDVFILLDEIKQCTMLIFDLTNDFELNEHSEANSEQVADCYSRREESITNLEKMLKDERFPDFIKENKIKYSEILDDIVRVDTINVAKIQGITVTLADNIKSTLKNKSLLIYTK